MNCVWIGIDNGVSGSIAIYTIDEGMKLFKTPTKNELSYTKKKQYVTRIDYPKLCSILNQAVNKEVKCFIERPMINPMRFKSSVSGIRSMETTLICLEELEIAYEWIDSKEWQKALLPKGLEKRELKKAAVNIAKRLYPHIETTDADSILICHYARSLKL